MFLSGLVLFSSVVVQAREFDTRSLCVSEDRRAPSQNLYVARANRTLHDVGGGCTATLIGQGCAVSAGHCIDYLHFLEFNVPSSTEKGHVRHSGEKDVYPVDRESLVYKDGQIGDDWAVFRVLPNVAFGHRAEDSQGGHYLVNFSPLPLGSKLLITGYGSDGELLRTFTQQSHTGILMSASNKHYGYRVDTTGGNSGSALVDALTDTIVGVHTNGGCYPTDPNSVNRGTSLAHNISFQNAVKDCLASTSSK